MLEAAIDFETYLISAEAPTPKPVCLSYFDGKNEKLVAGYKDMEKLLNILLSSKDVKIIAHNAKFEALVITKYFPHLKGKLQQKLKEGNFVCTLIYEKLIDNIRKKPLYNFSLANLVDNYFKVDISAGKEEPDAWRLRYSELDGIAAKDYPQEARDYAIQDSVWAYKLYQCQKVKNIDYKLSVEAEYYLNLMGLDGINIDINRVNTLEGELLNKLIPKYAALEQAELAVRDKKGKFKKKMKKFREYLATLSVKLEFTAKGIVSTSTESINRYCNQCYDQRLQDYLDVIKYEKVMTAFVSRLKQVENLEDQVIRSEYNSVVSSGRTSCRTSSHFPSVNIQQMPREVPDVTWDIRNCFIPRPGYKIGSIDYSGLELSSTANQLYVLTGKRDMLNVLNSGDEPVDMHSMFAYRLKNLKEKLNIKYEEFKANKKNKGYKEYRQLAKPINLGFPGGIGYDTMYSLLIKEGITPKLVVLEEDEYENRLAWKAKTLRKEGYPVRIRRTEINKHQLVYDELVELKQELFALYPDLQAFLNEEHKAYMTGETKSMKNDFGEWEEEPMYAFSQYGFTRDYCTYTAFCNGILMQSPSAIGAKRAMVEIIKKYQDSEDMRPLAFIHDEIVFEVKEDAHTIETVCKDVSEMLIDNMQTTLKHARIAVEAEVFDYWKKSGGFYEAGYYKNPGDKILRRA